MVQEKFFKKIPLFYSFTDKEYKAVIRIAKEELYAKNKLFFKEGQAPDALYIIVSGEVLIEKQPLVKTTEAITTLHLKEGDFFGELALFDQGQRTSTARAGKDTNVIVLKQEGILRLLKDAGFAAKFFKNIIQIVAARIRSTNRELMAFYEAGKVLGGPYDKDALLTNVLNIIISALEIKAGMILLKNNITGNLELVSVRGYKREDSKCMDIVNSVSVSNVFKEGKPLIDKAMLFLPFGSGVEKSGLVILKGRRPGIKGEDAFTQNDLNLVYAVMKQVETALENIQFYSDVEGRQRLKRQYVSL